MCLRTSTKIVELHFIIECGILLNPTDIISFRRHPVYIVQEEGWAPGPVWKGAKNFAQTGIFLYVILLDLRGSYIRVQNVLCSYGSQEACPLHSTIHVSNIVGDCGRVYHTIQTLYCLLNSKVCFLLPQLIVL